MVSFVILHVRGRPLYRDGVIQNVLLKMNRRYTTATLGTLALLVLATVIYGYRASRVNPYKQDGLNVEWDVGGASSSYPWIDVWVQHDGQRIEPDLQFGGIENPRLRFTDYDGDGQRDIVFEDDHHKQVVAFFPADTDSLPQFKVLKNDITSP